MRPTINFFIEESKTHSNKNVFGLCDDDNSQPAYIDEDITNKNGKWIAQVNNDSLKEIDFYPVDHCVEIKRADGKDAQKCEGILYWDDSNIVFTELKDRQLKPAVWLSDAENQIIETMTCFFDNYDIQAYHAKAWICNKQLTNQNYFQQILAFKGKTKDLFEINRGFTLFVSRSLSI